MKRTGKVRFSWRRRFDAWLAARRPELGTGIKLSHRRLYIVPTRAGLLFALVLLLMLAGAANYGSSMAFALVFLLLGVGINAIWLTHANLSGLIIEPVPELPVFAGQELKIRLRLENPDNRRRSAVHCGWYDESDPQIYLQIKALMSETLALTRAVNTRGWYSPPAIHLGSAWPLGLFHVWTVFRLAQKVLIYPQPAHPGIPLPENVADGVEKGQADSLLRVSGNDDFVGLRPCRPGDSPGRLDWRALARGGELQARQFQGHRAMCLLLDWRQLRETGVEARISRLCRWVLQAEACACEYGLRLPGLEIAPGCGAQHRHQVLKALALFGGEPTLEESC
ncbi:MAG: DUF58 domain-containing protein [Deltaproteobacteria bacterium]|nr:DUF58 domain-containing protein [Deltaproteobacteria bacterium]